MKFSKIELGRQGNFIFALLLIHFAFFGSLSNIYELKDIGEGLLFLYQVQFNPRSFISFIILFVIVFFMVFREQFFEYGIKNSLWLIPFIILESWFWFIALYPDQILTIGTYFIRLEGYLTILSLLANILPAALLAAFLKEKYKQYKEIALRIK